MHGEIKLPDKEACVRECMRGVLSHLSGSRSTMPITMIFFPGRMPPRMRPLNGTVYAKHIESITHGTGASSTHINDSVQACFITRRRDKSSLSGEMRPGFPSESFRWSSSTFFNTSDKENTGCKVSLIALSGRIETDPSEIKNHRTRGCGPVYQ